MDYLLNFREKSVVVCYIPPYASLKAILALCLDGGIIVIHVRAVIVWIVDTAVWDMRDACRRSRIDFRDVQTTPVGPCLHTVLHEVGQPALHADFLDLLLVSTRKSDFRLAAWISRMCDGDMMVIGVFCAS